MAQVAEMAAPSAAFALPVQATQLRGITSSQAPTPSSPSTAAPAGTSTPIVALAAVGVAAVSAVRRRGQRASKATTRAFESELGVQAPVGFFDPAGFTKDGDVEDFRRRREVELKNGRVAMFATMGYIVPEYFRFPGFLSPVNNLKFVDVPNGLAAFNKVPVEGWLQWVALCGFYETCVNVPKDAADPGNYGRGRLGFFGPVEDPEARKRGLNSELANGRLAMMAIAGMLFQNGFLGTTGPAMWIPGGAMPKDLENTGGPLPGMVFDPLGLSKDASEEQLLRWRAVELKHGRVSMLAFLGWLHVAAGWHPIGDGAAGFRVSNDPMISAAQLPMAGAFQVVFTIMCVEWLTSYVCTPPEGKPWDILGWTTVVDDDKADWKEFQLRELNNGRLAMMGIIGLIAQEAATGEYLKEIGEPCFGNKICDEFLEWDAFHPYPPSLGIDNVFTFPVLLSSPY